MSAYQIALRVPFRILPATWEAQGYIHLGSVNLVRSSGTEQRSSSFNFPA